jgi:hypothetical protein
MVGEDVLLHDRDGSGDSGAAPRDAFWVTARVDDPTTYPEFLPALEEHGAAVVDLGNGGILMSADAPRSAELYAARGFQVVTVPITEFEKLEGCVTCLSVRIRRQASIS